MDKGKEIKFKIAKKARNRFKNGKELQKLAEKSDYTQQVFFDYPTLMNYLQKLPRKVFGTDTVATEELNKLGIKIYLGIYPDDYETEAEAAEYRDRKGRLTMMLVPTLQNAAGVNEDQITRNKIINNENIMDEIIEAFNHGDLCPPYPDGTSTCPGSEFDEDEDPGTKF